MIYLLYYPAMSVSLSTYPGLDYLFAPLRHSWLGEIVLANFMSVQPKLHLDDPDIISQVKV